jgi:L-ascorbate metabolism protein UlaG (beta-lactamase superfamily)
MGRVEMVDRLISRGADVKPADEHFGRTPLHLAAMAGYGGVADRLLAAGADPNVKDRDGMTPVDQAVMHGNKKIALALAGKKAGGLKARLDEPSPLNRKLAEGEAVVWHLYHSGWAIKTSEHLLIIDYFEPNGQPLPDAPCLANGYIWPEEIKGQNVISLSSHEHGDHYHEGMFAWKETVPGIEFVMGHRKDDHAGEYVFVEPRTTCKVKGAKITTHWSNDTGVGFLVEVDGLTIFHPGDHASGRLDEIDAYKAEIDYIAALKPDVDIAFFPVRGCGLGEPEDVIVGTHYAVKALEPKLTLPMHSGHSWDLYADFAREMNASKMPTRAAAATSQGECFMYRKGKGKVEMLMD